MTVHARSLVSLVAVALAVAVAPSIARAATAVDCPPLPGAAALLAQATRIHVGEMHGTVEIPRTFATLVCHAVATKKQVRVGLEIPASEDAAIGVYLRSAGSDADKKALLAGAFWTDALQDGRRSVAWAELIERVRALRHSGADVDIATFDDMNAKNRDLAMAERASAAIARAPKAIWLLYSGNLHARKALSPQFKQTFMAMRLVAKGVPLTTLNARYGKGSAWVCFSPTVCGPSPIGGAPAAPPVGITLVKTKDGAYDGILDVGAAHFAPPAARAMTAAESARAATIPRAIAAQDAYDAKQWARCGELFDALAKETHASGDAYSAACCHALGGKGDAAFAALGAAVDAGYRDAAWLDKDDDLASLRADARWKPLVARTAAARPSSAK